MTSLFHGKDQNISTRVSGEKLQTNRQMDGISNYLIFVGPTKFSQTWGLHSIFTGFALYILGVCTLYSAHIIFCENYRQFFVYLKSRNVSTSAQMI